MKYWLIKSEPSSWSWDDQLAAKAQTTEWDGVRNYQANNHLKAMKVGDRCLFYRSVKKPAVVGIVEVVKAWELDPTDKTGKGFGMVTVKAIESVEPEVTLAQIKETPELAKMTLLKQSRLSVQQVSATHYKRLLKLSK